MRPFYFVKPIELKKPQVYNIGIKNRMDEEGESMEYESAHEAAERLKVTPRAVQKWAAGGKIPGAKRIGRAWAIPRSWSLSETVSATEPMPPQPTLALSQRTPLPLLSSAFPIGGAL